MNSRGNWLQKFDLYMIASEGANKPEAMQVAIFLHLIGDEGLQLFNTFTFAADTERAQLDIVKQTFATYCQPRKNIDYERYQFWKQSQATGETIDTFVTTLRTKAKSCEFGLQEESMIRDQIWYHLLAHLLQMKDVLFVCQYVEPFQRYDFRLSKFWGFSPAKFFWGSKIKISKLRSSACPAREFCVKISWQSVEGRKFTVWIPIKKVSTAKHSGG